MEIMKPSTIQLGNASLHIGYSGLIPPHQRGLVREITEFFVPDEHRGKGEGTALLQDVCDQADIKGLILMIIADTPRLQSFYARNDFVTIQDTPVILMVRNPRQIGKLAELYQRIQPLVSDVEIERVELIESINRPKESVCSETNLSQATHNEISLHG